MKDPPGSNIELCKNRNSTFVAKKMRRFFPLKTLGDTIGNLEKKNENNNNTNKERSICSERILSRFLILINNGPQTKYIAPSSPRNEGSSTQSRRKERGGGANVTNSLSLLLSCVPLFCEGTLRVITA